ncbi:hypothetical protein THAOC_17536, partial [Thalassiosira oceanica]
PDKLRLFPPFSGGRGSRSSELEERIKDTPSLQHSGREGSHYQEQRRQSEERGGRLRHRDYPGDALFAGVFGPGAAPPTRSFVVSPVHPSLHDAYYQADGHRSRRAAATTRFNRSSAYRKRSSAIHAAVRQLVDVSDGLEARAMGAIHDAREAEKSAAETRRTKTRRESPRQRGHAEDTGCLL